jgi:hypothetical protein
MVEVFDRRDVWVELNSPDRLPTSRGRRCKEVRKGKRKTLLGEKMKKRSVLKNSLTAPALLEMYDKRAYLALVRYGLHRL